ncbi:hypothetical protein ACHAXT_012249 [Thalassiosira profunda]
MWSSAYPSISHATAPAASDGGGGGGAFGDGALDCLDLGHAAQLNDDLLRTLREELGGIDSSLRAASGAVQTEERSFAQLSKDCDLSRGEMFDRRRGAAELLDGANLDDDVRVGFKGQIAAEVAIHVVSPDKVPRGGREGAAAGGEDEGAAEGAAARAWDHPLTLADNAALAESRKRSFQTVGSDIASTRKQIQGTDAEAAGFAADARERNLERSKAEGERKVEARRREREGEAQRGRGVREAVQAARANSGAHAQKIAEKAKEQMAERSGHVSKEAALAAANDAKGQELALLQAEETKLDAALAALSGQLDFLTKQSAEFEADRTKSDEMKVETEGVAGETAALGASKEAKAKEADESNAALKLVVAAFDEGTKAVADATAAKLANDAAKLEVFEPAAARKAGAIKEKERLAGEAVALQKSIEAAREGSRDAVAESESRAAAKAGELKGHKETLERARGALASMEKAGGDDRAALATELQEYKDFYVKFEGATKAEIDRLDQLKQERVDARLERLEGRRSEIAALRDERRGEGEYLAEAKALKVESREAKVEMETGEIVFDAEGVEIDVEFDVHEDRDDLVNEHGSLEFDELD